MFSSLISRYMPCFALRITKGSSLCLLAAPGVSGVVEVSGTSALPPEKQPANLLVNDAVSLLNL